jgi:hypothetical protein
VPLLLDRQILEAAAAAMEMQALMEGLVGQVLWLFVMLDQHKKVLVARL